ncbi:MAG: cupin domain-containing protein [Candidatus Omnitrophica bacterium]|nr:cupin domain-containing protein [Candidatus Omnitrophota bacterium]
MTGIKGQGWKHPWLFSFPGRGNPVTAEEIIRKLGLVPHPEEGGYYRETYRSTERILDAALPKRYPSSRAFGTAIYYLLTRAGFSELHRLPTDEIFHFYLGYPVEMLLLHPDGTSETSRLGPDFASGEFPQLVVHMGTWFGSRVAPGGEFALLGTTMAPGFEFADYERGKAAELIRLYPDREAQIRGLTRE